MEILYFLLKKILIRSIQTMNLDLDTILTDINVTTAIIGTANLSDLSVDFGTIPD